LEEHDVAEDEVGDAEEVPLLGEAVARIELLVGVVVGAALHLLDEQIHLVARTTGRPGASGSHALPSSARSTAARNAPSTSRAGSPAGPFGAGATGNPSRPKRSGIVSPRRSGRAPRRAPR